MTGQHVHHRRLFVGRGTAPTGDFIQVERHDPRLAQIEPRRSGKHRKPTDGLDGNPMQVLGERLAVGTPDAIHLAHGRVQRQCPNILKQRHRIALRQGGFVRALRVKERIYHLPPGGLLVHRVVDRLERPRHLLIRAASNFLGRRSREYSS